MFKSLDFFQFISKFDSIQIQFKKSFHFTVF